MYSELILNMSQYDMLNLKMVRNISIIVPPIEEQERIIREIEGYEAEIRKAEAVMQGAEARKSAILQKYLE